MSVYPSTSLKQARTFMSLDPWEVPAADEPGEVFSIRGQGSDEVWDAIENLSDALNPLTTGDTIKPAFDAQARELVHRHLAHIDEDVLSDADFWRYLSAVRFRDVVAKRHPPKSKSLTDEGLGGNLANFGALRSGVVESLFFRLFTAAELAYDEANTKDSYHLTKIHDVDLWQSHIVRVLSGDNPAYARSLVRWFQGRSEWYKACTEVKVDELFTRFDKESETRHLRDFVKRVRRIRSNIVHEFLSEPEVLEIVEHEALESLRNIESWGKTKN